MSPDDSVSVPVPDPVLTRTQVLLYALLALFVGTTLTGWFRDELAAVVGDRAVLGYGVYGVLVGAAFAILVAGAIVARVATLPAARRRRLNRQHTVALATAVVGYLTLAAVAPRAVGLVRPGMATDGLALPQPGRPAATYAPVAAAGITLIVLWAARRRFGRGRPGEG